jgi:hypothetical protein
VSSTPVAPTASSGAAGYGQQDIISALKSLIADLSNSQLAASVGGASSTSGVSAGTISALNTAFTKLISDLGGTTGASTPSGTATAGGTPATTSGTDAASGAQSNTAALQSFLGTFLQDLSGSSTPTALGNTINTTA